MSTQQQALIMETILAIRRTLKRKDYDSDSDSSIDHTTNRGNKLKKRARFVKQGRLVSSMGPAAYKEVAEHAGYHRAIISANPRLIDEEGYDIDSDNDEEEVQEAIASAMEDNPYSSVRLEQILAPLTAVTDLPSHPTLSKPFTSKALTELIEQGRNLMHKENAALWKAKPLLTKLVGDNIWAPCGLMTSPDDSDALLFSDTTSFFNRPASRVPQKATAPSSLNGGHTVSSNALLEVPKSDVRQAGTQSTDSTERNRGPEKRTDDREVLPDAQAEQTDEAEPGAPNPTDNDGNHTRVSQCPEHSGQDKDGTAQAGNSSNKPPDYTGGEDVEMADASGIVSGDSIRGGLQNPLSKATVLRPDGSTQSNNNSDLTSSRDNRAASDAVSAEVPPEELFIHPLFHLPPAARTERDLGLPEQEAEEVRRLLLLYVQKQEEICRGTKRLFEGLLKADRYRRTVWQWAKAEAHCGPNRDMSDGEDWYDKEQWGLTEDLKKGEDEVEEDTTQTQKKTRNRK